MIEPKLLPCPFCGREVALWSSLRGYDRWDFHCEFCNADFTLPGGREHAVSVWNFRFDAPSSEVTE